jgi:hypothetical protein
MARLGYVTADTPELDRGSLILYDDGNQKVRLNWNTTDIIDTGNNLGIGTTSATEKLSVSGSISASGAVIAGNITSNGYGVISQSGDFVTNEFIVAASPYSVTSSDALAVNSDGDLGIGTPNPEVRLHMLGEAPQTTQILMEQFNDTADAPDIRTRRYRGTSASRADVQTGDYLFRLNVHGQDDGTSELYGSMRFDVDGTDQDALEWGLQTRDTGGTVADRIKINSIGNVIINGDISSSGAITASGFTGDGSGLTGVGTVDTTGTPADNQIAVFTDSNTIEGTSKLTFASSELLVHSTNTDNTGIEIFGGVYGAAQPYISPVGLNSRMNFGDGTSGHIFDFGNNKIGFDSDSTNTYIQADTNNPENLEIHADGNIELRADDNLEIHGPISTPITASSTISASAQVYAGSYFINGAKFFNLSTGTSDAFAMGNNGAGKLIVNNITASGHISASGDLISNTLDVETNKLAKTSTTDGDHQGDVVFFGSTTGMTAGKIYYYNSSGNWALTDADSESSADGLLAVALGTTSDTDGMLIKGMVTLDHDPGTTGDPLFLSVSSGRASATAPSGTNDIVRLIGYCLDSTNGQIYFNPSNDFIKHS